MRLKKMNMDALFLNLVIKSKTNFICMKKLNLKNAIL